MSAQARIKVSLSVRVYVWGYAEGKEFVFLHRESCILEPHLVTDPVSILPLSASECVCVCYPDREMKW